MLRPRKGAKENRPERVASRVLKKASMTVEAAIALPLFIMAVICLVSIMNVYGSVIEKNSELRNSVQTIALAEGSLGGDTPIELYDPVMFKPYFMPSDLLMAYIPCKAYAKPWNGRSPEDENVSEGDGCDSVYVTRTGTVYHTHSDCSYLNPSVEGVRLSDVSGKRNSSGGKYYPCEECTAAGVTGGSVYITQYGDRYHSSEKCSAINRDIKLVSKDEAGSMCECSKCSGRD